MNHFRHLSYLLIFLFWICPREIALAQSPDAKEILLAARMSQSNQTAALEGRFRSSGTSTPFHLRLQDGEITYAFENPAQEIVLRLHDDAPELFERLGDRQKEVTSARFDQTLRNTGITYEDLSLSFLYWPSPKLLGSDIVRTRPAWKLQVQAPRKGSQYGVALLWIDKESGALLRIEGYDKQGKPLRTFEVVSAQKIDGVWLLKQMRVETLIPETRRVTRRDYLEITGLSKAEN